MMFESFLYNLQQVGSRLGLMHEPEHPLHSAGSELEQKKELLAILAHELRNPLAAILSSVELLKLQTELASDSAALLGTIEERVHAMTDMLNNLLTPVPRWRDITATRSALSTHTRLAPTAKSRLHSDRGLSRTKQARTILVVDDNEVAAEALGQLLRLRGHMVELAFNGASAIRKVREFHPQVIILDIGLPDIDGYEVAHVLRREKQFSSIMIALTGYGQSQDKERARKAGFHMHLTKPVGIREIEMAFRQPVPASPASKKYSR